MQGGREVGHRNLGWKGLLVMYILGGALSGIFI
jgi:hypothetical protein